MSGTHGSLGQPVPFRGGEAETEAAHRFTAEATVAEIAARLLGERGIEQTLVILLRRPFTQIKHNPAAGILPKSGVFF